jgi:hypothetical protein
MHNVRARSPFGIDLHQCLATRFVSNMARLRAALPRAPSSDRAVMGNNPSASRVRLEHSHTGEQIQAHLATLPIGMSAAGLPFLIGYALRTLMGVPM